MIHHIICVCNIKHFHVCILRYICIYLDLRHLQHRQDYIIIPHPTQIPSHYTFVFISGICSTDEIEWNRNGDGVIDFYPLHFLFPASKFSICIFVFTFTPFTSSSLQVGFSSLKGTTSNSQKKKKTKLGI